MLLDDFKNKGEWHSVAGLEFDWEGRLIVGLGDGHMYYPKHIGPEALVAQDLDQQKPALDALALSKGADPKTEGPPCGGPSTSSSRLASER